MSGELSILNCSAGDIRVKLETSNPAEIARAKKMITDMLKRGYLLAIEVEGRLEPVQKFDPETDEYVILESVSSPEEVDPQERVETKRKPGRPRGAYKSKRVPMTDAKAVAVPRTAGG